MAHGSSGSLVRQVESLQRQFAASPGLPFTELLSAPVIECLLKYHEVGCRERDYPPLVTLAMFLTQCQDDDPSLRKAVARLLAHQVAQGKAPGSSNTGAYSRARQRLPEKMLASLARYTGQELLLAAPSAWRWHNRDVKIIDGSTASMPDTPANQKQYPQMAAQQPGLGFPIMRFVVLFSLAVGTVLDAAFAPYQGKETSELALFRRLYDRLQKGDVVLGDRHFCSFFEIAELQRRSIDVVLRQHQRRKTDFRRGVQLRKYDHVVVWKKPQRPEWMEQAAYEQYPHELVMRELRVFVKGQISRTRTITLATTLLDARTYRKTEVAKLYRQRWQAELNLRSLKTVLHMDVLRCKTPEMVRKELWVHLLAYNLIRKVMAQAAQQSEVEPWRISFKATVQTLTAFSLPLLTCPEKALPELVEELLRAIARHRVGQRPGRLEPRRLKRRAKPYDLLNKPREVARNRELKT
jgi:hypothetical protein